MPFVTRSNFAGLCKCFCIYAFALFPYSSTIAKASPTESCYKLGETVTIRGYASGFINGGKYFQPLNSLCVDFPKNVYNGKRFSDVKHMTTMGKKVPPDIIVEATGTLSDPYPIHDVGIKIISVRDVDAQVRASIGAAKADADERCKNWRAQNQTILEHKTNGGRVLPTSMDDKVDIVSLAHNLNGSHRCGLMATYPVTHKTVTIWMPEPEAGKRHW
jgi:hypothetical protein